MPGQGDLGCLPAEIYTGRQTAECASSVLHHILDWFETTNCSCIPPQKKPSSVGHISPWTTSEGFEFIWKISSCNLYREGINSSQKTREKPSPCTQMCTDSHLLSFGFILLCTHASTYKHRNLELSYPLEKKKSTKYVPFCHYNHHVLWNKNVS